jgi:hypothetical protein
MSVAIEQVSRDDFAVVARDRRQRRTAACGNARRIDLWVGCALKKFVELQAAPFGHDIGSGEIERVKVGGATGGLHDQIGSHRLVWPSAELCTRSCPPLSRSAAPSAACARRAEFGKFLHEPADQIWVEGRKQPAHNREGDARHFMTATSLKGLVCISFFAKDRSASSCGLR